MNNLEERLWNYIDGTCSAEERKAIDILIAQDSAARSKHEDLLALNSEFSKIEVDEPSMAFTYNVMEGIRAEIAQKPLKAGINKRIIIGIAGFFIVSILLLLIFALSTIHIGAVSVDVKVPDSLKMPDLKSLVCAPVLKGLIFFDVVLGLFLFDAWLRRRSVSKQM